MKLMSKKYKIIVNQIKCKYCNDIITSYDRHDFKYCRCKRIFIDGGLDYLRRGFQEEDDYIDLSITEEVVDE